MSCINNFSNINETFIIEPVFLTGNSTTWSACTGLYTNMVISCDSALYMQFDSSLSAITSNANLVPSQDNVYSLGSPTKRYRQINTMSGSSTFWAITNLSAGTINLGNDLSGNPRIITPDTIILNQDLLSSGFY